MLKPLSIFLSVAIPLAVSAQPGQKNIANISEYEIIIKHYRYLKPDSASYFAQKGVEFARKTGDSSGVALILLQQGMIDDNAGNFENSERKYEHSLEIFRAKNEKKNIASTLIRIGAVKLRNGSYDKAMGYFLDALKISEELGDKYGIMEANYHMSWTYVDQNKFEQALKYLTVAEQYNQQIPFSNISLNIYNHLGIIYTNLGQPSKAKLYLEKGIEQSQQPEYQGLNINMTNNLANVYAKEGNVDKAITLQKEALEHSRKIGNYLREMQSLTALSKTYTDIDTQKAIFYLNQAVLLSRQQKVPRQEIKYLQSVADLYKAQKNYKEALTMKERQYILADSFYFKKMSQNIESLKAEYELTKSNARIKELNYINNKHQLELQHSVLLRNITFAGIIVLLVFLGLLYNQNRIRRRSNIEINKKNASLQNLLEEKEWLMKEIHHRVKNNLQIVISLLNTQSKYLNSPEAIEAISESTHRMQAMSLIHQKLYQTENAVFVNMPTYINELTEYLDTSFNSGKKIIFNLDIAPIELDISQAIPVGLLLNEAITNAIKHAFTQMENNIISISMNITSNTNILLQIKDNGKGIPEGFDLSASNTMGMRLMKGLIKQVGGKLSMENENGLKVKVQFTAGSNLKPLSKQITDHAEAAL